MYDCLLKIVCNVKYQDMYHLEGHVSRYKLYHEACIMIRIVPLQSLALAT